MLSSRRREDSASRTEILWGFFQGKRSQKPFWDCGGLGCFIISVNGKLRDELLNGEIFYTMKEAQILIERWRREYNTVRPHSALGYRPPAPEAIQVYVLFKHAE